MSFPGRRIVVTFIVAGTVMSFLMTQPAFTLVVSKVMEYVYSFLPEQAASFLRQQTYLTMVFLWFMVILGFFMWVIRGGFFQAESVPRNDNFEVIHPSEKNDDPPDNAN